MGRDAHPAPGMTRDAHLHHLEVEFSGVQLHFHGLVCRFSGIVLVADALHSEKSRTKHIYGDDSHRSLKRQMRPKHLDEGIVEVGILASKLLQSLALPGHLVLQTPNFALLAPDPVMEVMVRPLLAGKAPCCRLGVARLGLGVASVRRPNNSGRWPVGARPNGRVPRRWLNETMGATNVTGQWLWLGNWKRTAQRRCRQRVVVVGTRVRGVSRPGCRVRVGQDSRVARVVAAA